MNLGKKLVLASTTLLYSMSAHAVNLEHWPADFQDASERPECQISIGYGGMWALPSAQAANKRVLEYMAKSTEIKRSIALRAGREGEVNYCIQIDNDTAKGKLFEEFIRMLPSAKELAAEKNATPGLEPLTVQNGTSLVTTHP